MFLYLIAYLVEGTPWIPLIALLWIGVLALLVPTRARVERWIDRQRDLLAQEQRTS